MLHHRAQVGAAFGLFLGGWLVVGGLIERPSGRGSGLSVGMSLRRLGGLSWGLGRRSPHRPRRLLRARRSRTARQIEAAYRADRTAAEGRRPPWPRGVDVLGAQLPRRARAAPSPDRGPRRRRSHERRTYRPAGRPHRGGGAGAAGVSDLCGAEGAQHGAWTVQAFWAGRVIFLGPSSALGGYSAVRPPA